MPRTKAANPRKMPVQARSQATVDAILEDAARLLVTGTYDTFSTNRVAERAGVSVGSLYQYFPNKEALLSELMRRHVEELERDMERIMAGTADALADVVRAIIEANIAAHLLEPALHRALCEEVPRLGPLDARVTVENRAAARVRAILEAHAAELVVPDLDLATFLVVRIGRRSGRPRGATCVGLRRADAPYAPGPRSSRPELLWPPGARGRSQDSLPASAP